MYIGNDCLSLINGLLKIVFVEDAKSWFRGYLYVVLNRQLIVVEATK